MSNQAHKGQILPLANQMIPISNQTTFHASYDINLYGFNQGELVRPIGPEKALHFDGSTGYIDCGNSPMFSLGDNFTINMWIKPETLAGGIFIRENEYGIEHSGSKFSFFVKDINGTTINIILFTVPLNQWSCISAVADKANQVLNVYVNGQLNASTPYTVSVGNKNLTTRIGKSSAFYKGDIAMVSVYNRALAQESILRCMMDTPSKEDSSLIAYWRMNEDTGPLSYDYALRAIDAVWVGGVTPTNGYANATVDGIEGYHHGAVLIEPDTKNICNQDSISPWNAIIATEPFRFKGEKVYSATANVKGGWSFTLSEMDFEPEEYFTFSTWINRNTANAMPYFYCTGYTWNESTSKWVLKDPLHNEFQKEYFYYDEEGNDITATYTAETLGWVRHVVKAKNNKTYPVRVTKWHYLSHDFTSGTCYLSQPQVERRDWCTSFVKDSRPLGRLYYSKEIINPSGFTASFLFKIPKTHTYQENNKGVGGRSFTPIFEICSPYESGSGKFALVGGVDTDRRLNLIKAGVSTANKYGTTPYEDNKWHHLIIRYNGTTYEVYLDGKLNITHQDSFDPLAQNDVVMIGGGFYGKPNIYIDEVRIESHAISDEEVLAWAASGLHYNYLDYSF